MTIQNMSFGEAQPIYEARGLHLFPIGDNKRPAVKGYRKTTQRSSRAWARSFPDCQRFGFLAGERSGVTVLDIDEPGENALADAMAQYGQSPIVARTGSGNWHAWYRHAGEGRSIRTAGPHLDILGDGVAIAPPSAGYTFVQGGLNDLDRLRPMARATVSPSAQKIPIGERNKSLFKYCLRQAINCDDYAALLDCAQTWADDWFAEAMPASEIENTAASAWRYEEGGNNWVGYGERVTLTFEQIDTLAASAPDALSLYAVLKRHHEGADDFILAKAMAGKHLGWSLPKWRKARDTLVQCGLIECINKGGRGANDPPVYRFS